MQKLLRLAPLLVVAACPACTATHAESALPDATDVALGQRAFADGPLIQPVAVIEDSRCPANARCVWAGRVRVKMLWLRPTGDQQPFEVALGKATPIADGSITLDAVRPEKRLGAAIRPEDYRFSFHFAGGY